MKALLIGPTIAALSMILFAQIGSRPSYQQLANENEELKEQLAAIHNEVEDGQSELETLKSDVDDVQSRASECDDCDDVQSAASDLDGPIQDLESNLDEIETKSLEN